VLVVAAYGLILPAWTLALPRHGCINIHGSLLPRWRGAAPIQRAIEAGDAETGITIMQMDAGLDTGAMLLTGRTAISAEDTSASLHDRLAAQGAALVVQALADLQRAALQPVPQPAQGATYAAKIDKAEAAIDWRQDATQIERRLRAFDPFPGCTAELAGQTLKIWRARLLPAGGAGAEPGQRLPSPPGEWHVACGQGALALLEVQPPGGKRQPVREWALRQERG
jgi:methionyl-tRNA formyltransferase